VVGWGVDAVVLGDLRWKTLHSMVPYGLDVTPIVDVRSEDVRQDSETSPIRPSALLRATGHEVLTSQDLRRPRSYLRA